MPGIGGMHPGGGMFVGPDHPMFNNIGVTLNLARARTRLGATGG